MRIGALDSGKKRDQAAMVGTLVRQDPFDLQNKLYVIGAKFWSRTLYLKMEDEIDAIHRRNPFDVFPVEVNNVGEHVWEVLKYKKHMPVVAVTTGKDLKDIKKIQGFEVMDKNAMTSMMLQWKLEGLLVFPPDEKRTPAIKELVRQFLNFVEHTTASGATSYYAEGQEHDDGVMALMLNCWFARKLVGSRKESTPVSSSRTGTSLSNYQEADVDYFPELANNTNVRIDRIEKYGP